MEFSEVNEQLENEIHQQRFSITRLKSFLEDISTDPENDDQQTKSNDLLDIVNYLNEQIFKRKKAEQIYTSLIKNLQSGILLEDETRHIILANRLFGIMFSIPVDSESLKGADCSGSAETWKRRYRFYKKNDPIIYAVEPSFTKGNAGKPGKIRFQNNPVFSTQTKAKD